MSLLPVAHSPEANHVSITSTALRGSTNSRAPGMPLATSTIPLSITQSACMIPVPHAQRPVSV